ncbi:MAG TPA: alkaline phosphatase family protein [Edaphobacter sp.]|nr:alkaline phosphatase family protein [Edaphobacter sp.]
MKQLLASSLGALMALGLTGSGIAQTQPHKKVRKDHATAFATATPIKHVVIIFGENISFDHYFGTYPYALNSPGEPAFHGKPGTPTVNGLTETLLKHNPNFLNAKINKDDAVNPFRLSRAQAATADENHDYTAEQRAFNHGLLDSFPRYTGIPGSPKVKARLGTENVPGAEEYAHQTKGLVMGYYDGNTVTAMWNYAQRYAMNDNSFGSTFGPSTLGAIELVSGQTNGVIDKENTGGTVIDGGDGTFTMIGDPDPLGDVCSITSGALARLGGNNIGKMLTKKGVTWGWFEGGFDLTKTNPNGTTGCLRSTYSKIVKTTDRDYSPHHQPFQYYEETANLKHTRPTSIQTIGHNGDAGNHQYDTDDFFDAVKAGNYPAVSFLKAPAYQDAHAGYSDPLDEQEFVVKVINFLQKQPDWKSTAVIIAYDDSDGWYDHQMGPIVNHSTTRADALTGPGQCGDGSTALPGPQTAHAQGRCGYGPRLPLLVISPYSKQNYVDHTLTDQTSVLRFIEDNWLEGERVGGGSFDSIAGSMEGMFDFKHPNPRPYLLDPETGVVVKK